MKERTGSFGVGFSVLATIAACGLASLLWMRRSWRRTWPREAMVRAGLLPEESAAVVAVGES